MMPALSMLASLALLPLIASKFGPSGWVALGVGQSVGAIAAAFGSLAWPVIGGHRIASQIASERVKTYRLSALSRLMTLSAVIPLLALFMLALPSEVATTAILFMVGSALNGMTASWYFSGTGEPRFLVRNEGLVRLASYALALLGLVAGLGLWWYGLMTVAAGATSVIMNWLSVVGRRLSLSRDELIVALRIIPSQMKATLSKLLQSFFLQGANTVFTVFAPSSLAVFSAADQVKRVAGNALGVFPVAFVGWIGSSDSSRLRRRQKLSLILALVVSSTVAGFWWALGDLVIHYLFASEIYFTELQSWLLLGVIVSSYLSHTFELLLVVPSGMANLVYASNSVSAILGVVALAFGAHMFGVEGGLTVLLAVRVATLLVYTVALAVHRPEISRQPEKESHKSSI